MIASLSKATAASLGLLAAPPTLGTNHRHQRKGGFMGSGKETSGSNETVSGYI